MANENELVAKTNEAFAGFGITEIFMHNGELHTTSDYDLPINVIEYILWNLGKVN